MRIIYTLATALCSMFIFTQTCLSQAGLSLKSLAVASEPVDIANAGDGSNRLFIVQKDGQIKILDINTNTLLPGNFLDISAQSQNNGERGLLGLAFHPNYASNGYFYVNYIDNDGNTVISRFTNATPSGNGPVSLGTELVILQVTQPYSNHNGGDLAFGPDGYFYIPLGDGGSGGDPENRSQNPNTFLGKLLRIDVDNPSNGNNYGIPADNPFVGVQSPVDYLNEIWALGLRNPWRFSFDRLTGDMWIADVGQGAWEEVDFQPAGSPGGMNYGWRCYEGNHPYNTGGCAAQSNYIPPIFEYGHNPTTGGNSITGGFVYRGSNPNLFGWYMMADFTSNNFWMLKPNGMGGVDVDFRDDLPISSIVTFGEAENGEVYLGSLNGDVIQVSAGLLPIDIASFKGEESDKKVQLKWETAQEANANHFSVERKTIANDFREIGVVQAKGESSVMQAYHFLDTAPFAGDNFYRLKMVDQDGSFKYSKVVSVKVGSSTVWQLVPNPSNGELSIFLNAEQDTEEEVRMNIFDVHGKNLLSRSMGVKSFPYKLEAADLDLAQGVYFFQIKFNGKIATQRLVVN